MSAKDNPCRKFQANIFNKSKCQNCFKPRESHLLNDEDLNQAKPIYGGWLLLAPEGTDFDNPVHRSRKWQRRFFILYEHGLLRYALDEMPTTLPQGTINMNQCTDVVDGEGRTGQKFSLCIMTSEKEHFIRAENKEIINGWLEMLIVYPRTNKQNQKKKRKVEPPTPQEPGPAKVAVTSSSTIPSAEQVPSTKSMLWQEELRNKDLLDGRSSPSQSPVSIQSPLIDSSTEPMTSNKNEESAMNDDRPDCGRKARVESGYFSLEKTKPEGKSEDPPSPTSASPSSPSGPGNRYSYLEPLSPEYSDPFPPPGTQFYRRPTISSSLSSLDSELSSTTQTSGDGREAERPGRSTSFKVTRQYATLADIPRARRISHREAFQVERKRLEQKTRARSPGREEVERLFGQQRRRSLVIEKFEAPDTETTDQMETSCSAASVRCSETRQGRSEKRVFPRKRDFAVGTSVEGAIPDVPASPLTPYRRAKSLDRRSTESSMTPDLLNFKKGWLTKLYEDGQWKKHWFVLTDKSLRYYRDSVAEEASDIDGEIDLSTCYDVTEIPVQRNYGFQIHTKEGEFTLSAMTSGIRRNWIQTIMKHVRPTPAPDVTSSLPEEKSKTTSAYEVCPTLGDKQVSEQAAVDVEVKRSRARERRREGRSKTFDWAEFRPIQQALAQEKAKATESSSPIVTSSKDTNGSDPDQVDQERERTRRREERRKRFDAIDGSSMEDISRMEVDRIPVASASVELKPQNVHVEIEQRWHQVETTPLREEKQVPIAPLQLPASSASPGGLHSEKLASLLEKQLEQSQREVSQLLEQNLQLQAQLKESLERQQSARDGYVLQTEVATSSSGSWQRLHKVNEDLQNELEVQCRRQELINQQIQAIKLSYDEAKDVIRHHEAEAQSLQARLSSAAAELAIKEQTLTKLKSDLNIEKEKTKEQLEEWQQTETMLNSQLQSSELNLKHVEALLLEKTQELREIELQQALKRDYQKEMQRLQERLADLSSQLVASEKARISTEERLQKNYETLLENGQKEKQVLLLSLKEAEDKVREYEQLLQDDEQQMEALQKEKLNVKLEESEIVHVLEEQLELKEASIQKLTDCINVLKEERDRLICRCHEMMNQVTESDSEVGKLQTRLKLEETDYCYLENAFEKVSVDFQRMHRVLKEKEDELKYVKENQKKLVERKDQDMNEALIKMTALGNSLEETERRLQDALKKLASSSPGSQTRGVEEIGTNVDAVENLVPCFKNQSQALDGASCTQQSFNSLDRNQRQISSELLTLSDHSPQVGLSESQAKETLEKMLAQHDSGNIGAKRQRIRFSNIQFQKYVHADGSEKNWSSSTSSDTSQDRSLSEESVSSEPALHYITSGAGDPETYLSVIHSLETKLYITEEKLKDVTMKLESQRGQNQETLLGLHSQWATTESQLREHLQGSLSQVNILKNQLEEERKEKLSLKECSSRELEDLYVKKEKVFSCLKICKEKLKSMLSGQKDPEMWFLNLSSLEVTLSNVIQFLQKGMLSSVQRSNSCTPEAEAENTILEETSIPWCEPQELSSEDKLRLLSEKLALESSLLDRIADSLKNIGSGVSQALQRIYQTAEIHSAEPLDTTMSITNALADKLLLENEFWDRVDTLSKEVRAQDKEMQSQSNIINVNLADSFVNVLADCTLIKAELSFVAQKMKQHFLQKLKTLETDFQQTKMSLLQHRQILEDIIQSYRTCDSEKVMHLISKIVEAHEDMLKCSPAPNELAPAQQDSHQDEIIQHHSLPECSSKIPISCHGELAQELRDKAIALRQINTALLALKQDDCVPSCQRILDICHRLSGNICMMKPGYHSLLVQDAILQTQLCYATCKLKIEYERELMFYKDAWRSTDILCKEQAKNLAGVGQEYQEMLQKQQAKYYEIISIIQLENAELDAKASQLDCKERDLKEVEKTHRESILELKRRYEEEIKDYMEKLTNTEDTFQAERLHSLNTLDAVVKDRENITSLFKEQMQTLEVKHHLRIEKQQLIHQGELQALHDHYSHCIQELQEKVNSYSQLPSDTLSSEGQPMKVHSITSPVAELSPGAPFERDEVDSTCILKGRIEELEAQLQVMRLELEQKHLEGSATALSEKYQKDFANLKATCERGFAAMEETHQKKIEDLQRQHQRELEKLREEKERLLDEETAATISAIEAMKNAHREEMERELEKTQRSQISSVNADIDSLRRQYLEELQSVQRELEVLSEQYSQKCLENAHLAQALEAERQALRQCQRENQELNAHNQELNNRLAAEFTRLRMLLTGDGSGEAAGSPLTQGKDAYELEVLLRVKESEIQYQKQEISSLKDELQSALRDKKYASDKYKDMYTELSIVKAKADCDISRLKEQLKAATEVLGEKSPENTTVSGYDIMKSKSNPDFLKKDRASVNRQLRNIRSKSLKEGLTVQERMKLFESKDLKKH
ncbi:myosin phosphatase Rho-interacting protein isoform X3 [Lissotriton helveticus]